MMAGERPGLVLALGSLGVPEAGEGHCAAGSAVGPGEPQPFWWETSRAGP